MVFLLLGLRPALASDPVDGTWMVTETVTGGSCPGVVAGTGETHVWTISSALVEELLDVPATDATEVHLVLTAITGGVAFPELTGTRQVAGDIQFAGTSASRRLNIFAVGDIADRAVYSMRLQQPSRMTGGRTFLSFDMSGTVVVPCTVYSSVVALRK